jgi:hypothetical protein
MAKQTSEFQYLNLPPPGSGKMSPLSSVHPGAPPQRHQIRHAPSAAQRSRHIRCWRQPEEVWIEKPTEDPESIQALFLIQAA